MTIVIINTLNLLPHRPTLVGLSFLTLTISQHLMLESDQIFQNL